MRFEQAASQRAFEDYRGAVLALMIRREQLEREIADAVPASPWAQTARRLMCMRGIDTLTAAGLCAEIGDLRRFEPPGAGHEPSRPDSERAFLWAAPTAWTDHHVRQSTRPSPAGRSRLALPTPAAHGRQSRPRQIDSEPEVIALAWKTQRRLHHVWTRMEQRHKRRTIIAVAVAGFCWAVATID
ncbi:MAG TPA: hypothetical protein VNS09_14345 [Solirubrobacter sp.]|nr:hypothetical protein [Solirubrobacter sp.]